MIRRGTALRLTAGAVFLGSLLVAQLPFRDYPGVEYNDFEIPSDFQEKTEWAFARLMYPPAPTARFAFRGRSDWREGSSSWTQDYPRADRHFAQEIRRLTRVHVRSVEQPVNLDDGDDVFNYPWLYARAGGRMVFGPTRRRPSFAPTCSRGGFFMADDFWGTDQWDVFEKKHEKGFP